MFPPELTCRGEAEGAFINWPAGRFVAVNVADEGVDDLGGAFDDRVEVGPLVLLRPRISSRRSSCCDLTAVEEALGVASFPNFLRFFALFSISRIFLSLRFSGSDFMLVLFRSPTIQ